jgi:hypothetical protein
MKLLLGDCLDKLKELDDNWDEYYDKTYPTHAKKEKETHKEFMERLGDAWERDFGKK